MLKILTASQIKSLDEYTIKNEPIASIDLMERACQALVTWFVTRFDPTKKVGVVCGTGNNGGDGLVVARLLAERNYTVTVWIVRGSVPQSTDFTINLERLKNKVQIFEILPEADRGLFTDQDILIDAIFGSGLSRPAEGIYAQAIRWFNKTKATRVAIDIPSGLMVDKPSVGDIIHAHHTITFQLPKLSFLLPENAKYVGNWQVVNIGLSKEGLMQTNCNRFLLERKDIKKILLPRSKFSHKGNFGHALLIAGSYGKMGAAVLCARAAMRSGLGLLTMHIPKSGYQIMQTAMPEAMVIVDVSEVNFSDVPEIQHFTAIGVGPGIGQGAETIKALASLLAASKVPLVIDADAINILGSNSELSHLIPVGSILTPHPKEFERLVGSWNNDFERLEKQIEFSSKTQTVLILKGAYTSISTPDGRVYFNNTGNPGMATGGSGDVLTGLLTGLLARGYTSEQAAIVGAWIHGLAGDKAAWIKGEDALMATDIIEALPEAFISFR